MAGQTDAYVNKFYGAAVESAANTLTYSEISTNVEVFSKIAWVIHRLEWFLEGVQFNKLLASDDVISMALVATNSLTSLSLTYAAVIDLLNLQIGGWGTPATAYPYTTPFIRDFSELPGGGIIVAPRPLYVAVKGTSLASALTVSVRGYFTVKELKADEYLELIDFYRIVQ